MRPELDDFGVPESGGQAPDIGRVLQVVRRRRLSIILATLAALVSAVVMIARRPDVYEATAKVAIRATPPMMEIGPDVMAPEPRQQRLMIAAMVTLIYSSAVLGRVLDQMPQRRERESEASVLDRVRARLGLGRPEPEVSPHYRRELRIAGVRRAITVQGQGGATALLISARRGDPAFAAFLANAVADAFVRYRQDQREHASRRAITWLSQQTYELRERITRRELAIAGLVAKAELGPYGGDATRDSTRDQLTAELLSARLELMATEQRLAQLSPGTAATKEMELILQQYEEARAALGDARLRYTQTHPEVRRLEEMLARLESRLGPDVFTATADAAAEELSEYRTLTSGRALQEGRIQIMERALDELFTSDGSDDAKARSEYDRLERELELDKQMLGVLQRRHIEARLAAATEHPEVEILDHAAPPSGPVGPNRLKLLALGGVFAFAFGSGVGLLREWIDRQVRDPEEVASILGVPSLGLIPMVHDGTLPEHQSIASYASYGSSAAESYRNLRTSLMFTGGKSRLSSLVVTSAITGEGKTSVSANLAASFARMGTSVLLVDGDLRRPRVHRLFSLPQSPGLAEVLQGKARLEEVIQKPVGSDVRVLTSGEIPDNPSELLASSEFTALLAQMKTEHELVLLDSPILLAISDALLIAAVAEGTLLVNKPGSVDRKALERMRFELKRAGADVVGVVFNQVERTDRYVYPSYLVSPYVHEEPPYVHKSRRFRSLWRGKTGTTKAR